LIQFWHGTGVSFVNVHVHELTLAITLELEAAAFWCQPSSLQGLPSQLYFFRSFLGSLRGSSSEDERERRRDSGERGGGELMVDGEGEKSGHGWKRVLIRAGFIGEGVVESSGCWVGPSPCAWPDRSPVREWSRNGDI
jgi:hypothetical protein